MAPGYGAHAVDVLDLIRALAPESQSGRKRLRRPPPDARSQAEVSVVGAREVRLVAEAGAQRDLRERQFACPQIRIRELEPPTAHVAADRLAPLLAEGAHQVVRVHVRQGGQCLDLGWVGELGLQALRHAIERPPAQRGRVTGRRTGHGAQQVEGRGVHLQRRQVVTLGEGVGEAAQRDERRGQSHVALMAQEWRKHMQWAVEQQRLVELDVDATCPIVTDAVGVRMAGWVREYGAGGAVRFVAAMLDVVAGEHDADVGRGVRVSRQSG
jgi:hypothetical protein